MYPVPTSRPAAVAATAATLAVAVAVGSDVVAGGPALHTISLGLVGVVVAALRIRFVGRHRGLFAAVTASFVAQPVLHAATKVLGSPVPSGSAGHAIQETSFSALPVVVAAVIVATVACAEHLMHADVVRALGRWLRMIDRLATCEVAAAPIEAVRTLPGRRWDIFGHLRRRGPPVAGPVPAV